MIVSSNVAHLGPANLTVLEHFRSGPRESSHTLDSLSLLLSVTTLVPGGRLQTCSRQTLCIASTCLLHNLEELLLCLTGVLGD
jgi:hypothetical protein